MSALLDQTRRLETALQRWAALEISENEVSDVFVTVGNTFHAMLAAFAVWNIDMRYVHFPYVYWYSCNLKYSFHFSICFFSAALPSRISLAQSTYASLLRDNQFPRNIQPFLNDLRRVLEDCLSEDPTPANVAYLLPQVRAIIAALLTGLKERKDAYWQAVRAQSGTAAPGTPVSGGY